MNLIHCLIHEFGGCSMVPELAVPALFLLQGIKFLQISHQKKFQSIGGLRPRTGIPWIWVCI